MLNKFLQTSCLTVAVGLSAVMGSDAVHATEIHFPTQAQIRSHMQPSTPTKQLLEPDNPMSQWYWAEIMVPEFPAFIDVDGRSWHITAQAISPLYAHNETHPIPPTLTSGDIALHPLEDSDLIIDQTSKSLLVTWPANAPKWPSGSMITITATWNPTADTIPTNTDHVHVNDNPPRFEYF